MRRFLVVALLLAALAVPILGIVPGGHGGMIGTAAASTNTTCNVDYTDKLSKYGYGGWMFGVAAEQTFNSPADISCETYQDNTEYYQAAKSRRDQYQAWRTTWENGLQYSKLAAYSKLEKAVLYEYDNGTSLSSAKISAQAATSDFYGLNENNLLENWKATSNTVQTWENESDYDMFSFDSAATNFRAQYDQGGSYDASLKSYDVSFAGLGSKGVTLANGTSKTVPTLLANFSWTVHDNAANDEYTFSRTIEFGPYSGGYSQTINKSYLSKYWYIDLDIGGFTLNAPPSSSFAGATWLQFDPWADYGDTLSNEYNAFDNQTDSYTEGIYNGLDSGQISYSDAISRATKVDDYLLTTADENTSFSMTTVAFASMGLNAADVANTSYMRVEMNTTEYDDMLIERDGMILSRYAPAGGWQYNTTFDSANISGAQTFVTTDGEQFTIEGNFTLLDAIDRDGEHINASDIQSPDIDRTQTYNASSYIEFLNRSETLINRLDNITSDDTAAGAGGGGGWSWPNPLAWLATALGVPKQAVLIGLLAVAVVVVLGVIS